MEVIVLLFIVIAVVNAISSAAKRGARPPARPPRPYPEEPPAGQDWEEEVILFGPETGPRPVVVRPVRTPPPLAGAGTGERKRGQSWAEARPGDGEAPAPCSRGEMTAAASPARLPARGVERLLGTREGLLAAVVFHELLQPPLSRRPK